MFTNTTSCLNFMIALKLLDANAEVGDVVPTWCGVDSDVVIVLVVGGALLDSGVAIGGDGMMTQLCSTISVSKLLKPLSNVCILLLEHQVAQLI
jgi:hypothetical protein